MIAAAWSTPRPTTSTAARLALALLLVSHLVVWHSHASVAAQPGLPAVSGSILLTGGPKLPADKSGVVVWLTPPDSEARRSRPQGESRPRLSMVQRGKRFLPRVLVVKAGSAVDFPNADPIFHNVFSLFEGKRFDLGLYEAGTSRSVTFAVPGMSYIFCNIHPEMSGVVVAVDTDHFTTSIASGAFSIAGVPPGRYRLNVWHDRFKPERATEYPKDVTVEADGLSMGTLILVDSGRALTTHKNKFGHDYVPPNATAPTYR